MTLPREIINGIYSTIRNAVKEILAEALEIYSEEWLTPDELCEQVHLFNKEWMRRYWKSLPCTQLRVRDENGVWHESGRRYPKKKILRMIANGEIQNLKMPEAKVS